MQLIDLIRSLADQYSVPFIGQLPDLVLVALVIAVAILVLRLFFDLLSSLLRIGCSAAVVLLIIWLVLGALSGG